MADRVYITDTAAVTAIGGTLEETWRVLLGGKSGRTLIPHFSTDKLDFHHAATVSGLHDGAYPNRIMELMCRGLHQLPPLPEKTAIIWTGGKENVEYVEKTVEGKDYSGPVVSSDYRKWVADFLKLPDEGMEVNAACASSTVGIALGAELLAGEKYDAVLVCAADIVSRFTFTGFAALKALSPGICRPFDSGRDGLMLGDAAAAVLLEREPNNARTPVAEVTGWGIANDANHITGPARDGRGLIKAAGSALNKAGITPEAIHAYCAHGTGTVYNDAMELTALKHFYGEKPPPLFSIKGAVGHTLGVAGALEAAVCGKVFTENVLPPTTGLQNPEPYAVNAVGNQVQQFSGNTILSANSGFGGINAAVVLERVES